MSPVRMPRRCERCDRRYKGRGDWNVTVVAGVVVGLLCPSCQSIEENAEAEVNRATLDYGLRGDGRLVGTPKGGAA